MYRYECPDCRSAHDEPADAGYGFRNRCRECELDDAYRLALYANVEAVLAA